MGSELSHLRWFLLFLEKQDERHLDVNIFTMIHSNPVEGTEHLCHHSHFHFQHSSFSGSLLKQKMETVATDPFALFYHRRDTHQLFCLLSEEQNTTFVLMLIKIKIIKKTTHLVSFRRFKYMLRIILSSE